jgi:hypothetical protein
MDAKVSCDAIVTHIEIGEKSAFIFNPATLPCVVSIGHCDYYLSDLDAVRNSKNLGIFKEAILKLLTTGE